MIDPGGLVRVLVLDDHRMVAEGLRLLVEGQSDMRVVAEAAELDAALALDVHPDPDVILADLVLGSERAAEVVTSLRARFPGSEVLVLTMVHDADVVRSVLSAGARGYLPKDAVAADLVDAIRRVARREDYLQHSVGVALARGDHRLNAEPSVDLSERELAVGRLLALGHTNAEVADMLIVSVRTVETYRAHVFRKLGVRTRAELLRVAIRTGLVDLSSP
jgi:two-component system response regulator NreC